MSVVSLAPVRVFGITGRPCLAVASVFDRLVGGCCTVLEDEDVVLMVSSAAPALGAGAGLLARFEEGARVSTKPSFSCARFRAL